MNIKAVINGVAYELCKECGIYRKVSVVKNPKKKTTCMECRGNKKMWSRIKMTT
jgi:hypothetical protein